MGKDLVLVTGGTGYIGSHTVVELQNAGKNVIVVDNLMNSKIEVLDRIEKITGKKPLFIKLDLCDYNSTIQFFKANSSITSVVHFAALKSVGESSENPLLYYNNNVKSIINLLEGIKITKVRNFIFSSSCTVYGQPDVLPVKESSPLKEPKSPYGATKQISERILRDFANTSELNVISLRYFNPIGAHESAQIGELPLSKPTNLVPLLTQTAIGKRKELIVYGNDYKTPDGTCIRDYIHVKDVAKAHIDGLQILTTGKNENQFEAYNLGTGKGTSVMEIINTFELLTNIKLNYKIGPRRKGDVEQVYANAGLAKRKFGWETKFGLNDMLLSAWNWEKAIHTTSSVLS